MTKNEYDLIVIGAGDVLGGISNLVCAIYLLLMIVLST